MESGAFAGAPAEAVEQPQTPPEPVTPEQVAAEMNDAEATEQTGGQSEETSVQSTLDEMRQKLDQVLEQREEPESAAPGLLAALNDEEEPFEETGQHEASQGDDQAYGDPARQQAEAEFRAFVRNEVQQAVTPIQQERRDEQLEGIEQQYPDITTPPVLGPLKEEVAHLVQLSGNESLKDHPAVVLMAYRSVKARLADVDAVPAESAAGQGASLETHSGVGNAQAGEQQSVEDYYKQNVYKRTRSDL